MNAEARRDWFWLAFIVIACPVAVAAGMEAWPHVYRYIAPRPFHLLFIVGGVVLAYFGWLVWWASRPSLNDPHDFGADDTRRPWDEPYPWDGPRPWDTRRNWSSEE